MQRRDGVGRGGGVQLWCRGLSAGHNCTIVRPGIVSIYSTYHLQIVQRLGRVTGRFQSYSGGATHFRGPYFSVIPRVLVDCMRERRIFQMAVGLYR